MRNTRTTNAIPGTPAPRKGTDKRTPKSRNTIKDPVTMIANATLAAHIDTLNNTPYFLIIAPCLVAMPDAVGKLQGVVNRYHVHF